MDRIAEMLTAFSAPNVFNPWRDVDPLDIGGASAPRARLTRLRRHFDVKPSFLLVGEAPGYQGCHFSGVAFTNESLLCDGAIPRIGKARRLTTRDRPWCEPSATIVWGALHHHALADDVVMWNAFAFHPHRPGELHSNRAPTRDELKAGEPILRAVLDHFPECQVIAVGNVAALALAACGFHYVAKVRHPSMGGATAFRAGIAQLATNLAVRKAVA